jgi:hypothetical protein
VNEIFKVITIGWYTIFNYFIRYSNLSLNHEIASKMKEYNDGKLHPLG